MVVSTLAIFTGSVDDLAVDGSAVYFVDSAAGTINKVAKSGGASSALATGQAKPLHLAHDASSLYWGNYLGGAIMRLTKSGGTPALVAAAAQPTWLVVDDCHVYWINAADMTVKRAAKSGASGATTVYAAPFSVPSMLAQNGSDLFVVTEEKDPACPSPCFTPPVPLVRRVPKDGSAGGLLYSRTPNGLAATGSDTVVSYEETWMLISWKSDAMDSVPWTSSDGSFGSKPTGPIVADGADIYFRIAGVPRRVQRCLNRWPALVIDSKATMFALDGTHFYWSDGSMIGRAPK